MPTLLEVQRAAYRSLVEREDAAAIPYIFADGLAPKARLNIYRNTFIGTLTSALGLTFPAVRRLVGAAFFESAARLFIEATPPRGAYLDAYGEDFAAFLEAFEPAASLPYLPGVARLEWTVNRALHACDTDALDTSRLSSIEPGEYGNVAFVPHPSLGLVRADHPVDAIWRAVLGQDDAAMAAVDPAAGPVWLVVQRHATGVEVKRLTEPAWCLLKALCAGHPLQEAIESAPAADAAAVLSESLVAGRFIDFELIARGYDAHPREISA